MARVAGRLAYVGASERILKCSGRLLWYPFARLDPVDEQGWCLLVDCFAAPLVGSSVARLLLSRRVEIGKLELHSKPPVEAPQLEPLSCGQEVLEEIRGLGGRLSVSTPSFSPFEPVDYAAVRMLGSRMALKRIEEFFKGFVRQDELVRGLLEVLKPERLTYWGVLYLLLCIDERRRAFFFVRREKVRSTLHETYLLRGEVRRKIPLP